MTVRLNDVLAKFESLLVDDEKAAEYDRMVAESRESEARARRRTRLDAEDIELLPEIHRAIVNNAGLKNTRSLTAVRRWLWSDDVPPVLILVGGTGCGKSVAASWSIANGPDSSCWRNAEDAVRTFAGYFGDQLEDQTRMKRCGLLVLDDVATEPDPLRMQVLLVELLKTRMRRKTLITTNKIQATWQERYPDERLHSRLKEIGVFVYDGGTDLRGVQK
jgi:DNA replication protein DnaC